MAKGMYIGVGGTAKKVKKMYFGVGGVARKVKKAYMGVDGVARCIFGGEGLEYYGTATELQTKRYTLAAATVGNYALFAGGENSSNNLKVDAYNKSLTRTICDDLSSSGTYSAATTIGDYALFSAKSNTQYTYIDAYDTSLTKIAKVSSLTSGCASLAAATVGNYALFAGGIYSSYYSDSYTSNSYVNAFDASLTKTTVTNLSYGRHDLAAATVGNYALFGGGLQKTKASSGGSALISVEAYDTSLTKTTASSLSTSKAALAATTIGNYALFAGGASSNKIAEAYDTSLTKTTTTASIARRHLAAATVGNYALFAGGRNFQGWKDYTYGDGYESYSAVDVYDKSLTQSVTTELSVNRAHLAATTVGDYALFAGGVSLGSTSGTTLSTVDVYQAS